MVGRHTWPEYVQAGVVNGQVQHGPLAATIEMVALQLSWVGTVHSAQGLALDSVARCVCVSVLRCWRAQVQNFFIARHFPDRKKAATAQDVRFAWRFESTLRGA